jgi:isopentenyl diphosphate isomerase/L-lactate dehydrogenase-like FMN-dependent dehydrogenase
MDSDGQDDSVDFVSTADVLEAARANLSKDVWDKLIGGTESETTLRRNRLGFDSLAFRPRIQACDAQIDASSSFLGKPLRAPIMISPIGSLHHFTPDGALASGAAAAAGGTMAFISSACHAGFEEVAAQSSGPLVLQLAIRGDIEWCGEVLQRARDAGYIGVCVTLDTARLGRQERQIINNGRAQTAEHPFRAGLTWTDIDEIKRIAGLPVVLKGIGTSEDARIAVDHGVDAICVSNHGGHGLDHGRAVIDILPEVVEAVSGRAEVVMDGGVMRGTDIVKALARGAQAAMVGKLQGIGLAAGGESGLTAVLQVLEDEILTCFEFLGVSRMDELEPGHVASARPVNFPTELSAFPHVRTSEVPR